MREYEIMLPKSRILKPLTIKSLLHNFGRCDLCTDTKKMYVIIESELNYPGQTNGMCRNFNMEIMFKHARKSS